MQARPDGPPAPSVTNRAFLRAIFGGRWKDAHVTAFPGDPKHGHWKGWRAGERPGLLERANLNTFYAVSLFTGPDRSAAAFAGLYVVILDDVGAKADRAAVLAKLGAPTYRLETSPGNEQWGYVLEAPELDRGRAAALLDELVRQGLTDPGAKDVPRYCRLPAGTNWKPVYGPAGFRHVLRERGVGRRFTPDGLMTALGGVLPAPGAAQAARPRKPLDPAHAAQDAVLTALRELGGVPGPTSNEWGYQCVCPCVDGHTGRDETGCAYSPGEPGQRGMFKCHHGSCAGRDQHSFMDGLNGQLRRAGLLTMAAREFNDVHEEALGALWRRVAQGEQPTPAECDDLAQVDEEDVERVLRPAVPIFGTDLAPIRAALKRARRRDMRRYAAPPRRVSKVVPLPAGYQKPVPLEETQAAMKAALDRFAAATAAGTVPLQRRGAHAW